MTTLHAMMRAIDDQMRARGYHRNPTSSAPKYRGSAREWYEEAREQGLLDADQLAQLARYLDELWWIAYND